MKVRTTLQSASIVMCGLAAFMAHESRHPVGGPDETRFSLPGLTVDTLPSPGRGLVVTSLRSGSEAQQDGIAVGDEVLAIDNLPVESLDEAQRIIGRNQRDKLALRLLHDNSQRELVLHVSEERRDEP